MPPSPSAVPMTPRTWPLSPSSWPHAGRETSPGSRSTSTAASSLISRSPSPCPLPLRGRGIQKSLASEKPPHHRDLCSESECFRSLSPIGGEGRVRGQTPLHECSATYLLPV